MEATKEELFEYHTQPTVASAKNGADIALAIDAMDILYAGAVTAFCIVSNDRDFVPLALRLRAAGKPFKVAMVAAMRKLLTILNQMVKHNEPWRVASVQNP